MTLVIGQIRRNVVGMATTAISKGDDCSEGTEHEGEHEQRSERGQQRPEQHSGAVPCVSSAGRAERVNAGDP